MYTCKSARENVMPCRECLFCLAINRENFCQTFSLVENAIVVLFVGCLVLLGLTEKSINYMKGLRDKVKMITPRAKFKMSSHDSFCSYDYT